jgi:hypothetical protein
MTLPLGFGKLDFGDWLYGLFSGVISGGAGSILTTFTASTIAPESFNMQHPSKLFWLMGVTFGISGVMSAANFLAKRPLPSVIQVKDTVKTVEVEQQPTKIVTTHEEVSLTDKKDG